jgi:hypothetical protein
MLTISQIAAMRTSELVAFYNHHSIKPVSKFQDRATAERRVLELAASLPSDDDYAATPSLASMIAPNPLAIRPEAERVAVKAKRATVAAPSAVETPFPLPPSFSIKCPSCGSTEDQTYADEEGTAAGERMFCHHCSTEYHADGKIYKRPVASVSRSAAIAASWANPEVAAARATRVEVVVEGMGAFKSVPAAFRALNLPMGRMIPFRLVIKAQGEATFTMGDREYFFHSREAV